MPGLDFSNIKRRSTADSATEPRAIFTTLPSKDKRYSYARDVQSEVWDTWHRRRNDRDLVVKMNTGGGKTVVGLVVLKSCLNEGAGPAVYLTPDKYLTQQVCDEAEDLGIPFTQSVDSALFLAGKAILVANVYKMFNGRSVFGIRGSRRSMTELGTVLVDDAHACLATVDEQFTLRIPGDHDAYDALLELFTAELEKQAPPMLADLQSNDPSALMAVPFWTWADKQAEVLAVLHPHRNEDDVGFHWPLVKDSLPFCRVAVSPYGIEIAPPCVPVDAVPSFVRAKRRIYLTATLADDSILVTHFGADAESIRRPITPRTADDLGDRMILTPQESFPGTSDDAIRDFLVRHSATENVVVIVPSARRSAFWADVADEVHTAETLQDNGIAALRSGEHVGLVVLVNKYDGIDLPGDACRILVLDGLPEAQGELARMESTWLDHSDALLIRQVQRIEQGMGRGIRSNDDYCVVLLLGKRLTGRLHPPSAREKFSPATKAQLGLSDLIATQLEGLELDDLGPIINQCLERDPTWVAASRDAVVGLTYDAEVPISDIARAQREAFEMAQRDQFADAAKRLREAVGEISDPQLRGLVKQQAATYLHFSDAVGAQKLQVAAVKDNRSLTKPRAGIAYVPLRQTAEQAIACVEQLSARYKVGTDVQIGFEAVADQLVPDSDPSAVRRFEQAIMDLGLHLGFGAQRPELETGDGPDVLWMMGDASYVVIECKSGATTKTISRSDISQLAHSVDWFRDQYGTSLRVVPVLVHPTAQLHHQAHAPSGARVITFEKLASLRDALGRFATSVASDGRYRNVQSVAERLSAEHLANGAFVTHWSRSPRATKRR
jgi:Helicase C-terminal domain/DEAD/DEAH box helicase